MRKLIWWISVPYNEVFTKTFVVLLKICKIGTRKDKVKMKKIFCILIIIVFSLCSCTNKKQNNNNNNQSSSEVEQKSIIGKSSDDIVLPNAQLSTVNLKTSLDFISFTDFRILEALGDNYYGYKSTKLGDEISEEYCLTNQNTNVQTPLNYQSNTKDWVVSSDSKIVMQNRYLYEWKSYTQQITDETIHDVKLIRVDGKTGDVKIIDEIKQSSPFVYMCKINDKQFLSYSISKAPSDKTGYSVISAASIYDIDGKKQNIICEKYENDESWSDSNGTLIEQFAVNNGEIYGYGRRLINNQYKHFLYHYGLDGQLIDKEVLNGFENIIGSEQPIEFSYLGNYISFRTYESVSNYICKKDENGIKLIMKGINGQVQYAVVGKYILFIENNVDVNTGEIKTGDYPIYIIDSNSDVIKAANFQVPIYNPYFNEMISLSNNKLLLSYCENTYDPLKVHQFLIDYNNIDKA